MGKYFKNRLEALKEKYPQFIGDVRGVGLMVAIELIKGDNEPDAKLTATIKNKALEKNVLLLTCGNQHNVVRFIAPLTVTEKEIDKAVNVIDEILAEEV